MSYKNFAILIPSRIGSTRLKNKALIEIDKKPLIEHVIRGAIKSNLKVPIIVATDTQDIVNIAERCGQIGMLTSKDHKSGSDRIYEALEKFDPQKKIKKIIHLQGDLPNVSKKLIVSLADIIKNNKCIATPVVQADKNEILDLQKLKNQITNNRNFQNVLLSTTNKNASGLTVDINITNGVINNINDIKIAQYGSGYESQNLSGSLYTNSSPTTYINYTSYD